MKKILTIVGMAVLGLFLASGSAHAIVIDGSLSDWNSAFLVDTDGIVGPGGGGQYYDVELTGLFADSGNVYFGIQAGQPFRNSAYDRYPWSGDLFFDIGNDGVYEYAIDYRIDYNGTPTFDGYLPIGSGTGDIVYSLYDTSEGIIDPYQLVLEATPYQVVKNADSFVAQSGVFSNAYGWFNDGQGFHNVMEGYVPMSLLGLAADYFEQGGSIKFHYTMNCGNDVSENVYPVPEPASVLVFGLGALGLFLKKKFF